jgi:hypothetical protein
MHGAKQIGGIRRARPSDLVKREFGCYAGSSAMVDWRTKKKGREDNKIHYIANNHIIEINYFNIISLCHPERSKTQRSIVGDAAESCGVEGSLAVL